MYLENNRLRLRAPEPCDAEVLFRWENSSDDWHTSLTTFAPLSLGQIRQHIFEAANNPFAEGWLRLVAEDKDSGKAVGSVELTDIHPVNGTASLGFYVDRDCRGNGIGRDLVALAAEYTRDILALRTLMALTAENNKAARSVLEKNGFIVRGTLSSWKRGHDGSMENVIIYQIIF